MFCTGCGVQLNEEDLFCARCGRKVVKKEEEERFLTEREEERKKEILAREDYSHRTPEDRIDVPGMITAWTERVKAIDMDRLWRRGVSTGKIPALLAVVVVVLLISLIVLIGGGRRREILPSNAGRTVENQISDEQIAKIEKLLEEGGRFLTEGNIEKANASYEQAKAVNAAYEDIYLFGADIYLKQNNYNRALQILKEGQLAVDSVRLTDRISYIQENVFLVGIKSQDGEKNFYYQYNEAGNLFKEHTYDGEYGLTGWKEHKYDERGRKTESIVYNIRGEQQACSRYEYDEQGKLICQKDYDLNQTVLAAHWYGYDGAGRLVSCDDYDSQGRLSWSTRTEYDDQGRKVKDMGYDGKGVLKSWVETTYHADGSIAKIARYDENNQVVEWNESQVDEAGREVKATMYDGSSTVLYWQETEYAPEGIKTARTRYNADGSVHSRIEYDYAGNKVTETLESQQTTYQYAYFYFGDILCEIGSQPVQGRVKLGKPVSYRRLPNMALSSAGILYTDKTYAILGQTGEFYQLAEGGYLEKALEGEAYTIVE